MSVTAPFRPGDTYPLSVWDRDRGAATVIESRILSVGDSPVPSCKPSAPMLWLIAVRVVSSDVADKPSGSDFHVYAPEPVRA